MISQSRKLTGLCIQTRDLFLRISHLAPQLLPINPLQIPLLLANSPPYLISSELPSHNINSPRHFHAISTFGIDMLNVGWAQRVGGRFTIRRDPRVLANMREEERPPKQELGHNLYSTQCAHDFSTLGNTFCGTSQAKSQEVDAEGTRVRAERFADNVNCLTSAQTSHTSSSS